MDTTPNVGNDLVRIHKVITRALDVSIQNTTGADLDEGQREGFVLYVRSLVILLHAHHNSEDELAFPFLKTRIPDGPFDQLVQQHAEMITYLDLIEHWLESGPDAWHADALSKLNTTLSDLNALWHTHITLEEDTVGPESSQQYLTPEENEQLGKQLTEYGQAHSQPSEVLMPFVVYNLSDTDREDFFKVLPPMVTQELIPGAWKAAWEPMTPFLLTN